MNRSPWLSSLRAAVFCCAIILCGSYAHAQTAGWEFPSTSSYTATSADNGKVLATDNVPGATITVTLPTPSVVGAGWLMGFSEANGHGIIANTPSGSIFILAGQKTLQSISVPSNTNYEYFAVQSDGTNFRLLVATTQTARQNGLSGNAGGLSWTQLFSNGYTATPADNGSTLDSTSVVGPVTVQVTLPSTPLLPNGWTLDVSAGPGNPVTVNLNGVSGGTMVRANKSTGTHYTVLEGAYVRFYYTGMIFQVSTLAPPIQSVFTPANTGWGPTGSLTSVSGLNNGAVGVVLQTTPPATVSFPTGVSGAGLLMPGSTGNAVFAMYAEADLADIGTAVGAEIDCMNFAGAPDLGNLPPFKPIGTPFRNCIGLQVGAGGTFNGSVGIMIAGAQGGIFSAGSTQRWGTGLYIGSGNSPGEGGATGTAIFVDADAAGPSVSEQLQNYGNGINLQLGTTGAMQANNAVISVLDSSNIPRWGVKQNGSTIIGNTAASGFPSIDNGGNASTLMVTGQVVFATYANDNLSGLTIQTPGFWQDHARGTESVPLAVATNDVVGQYTAAAYDGAAYRVATRILSTVNGGVGSGIVPGKMEFQTANTGGSVASRLTLDALGSVIVGAATGEGAGTFNVQNGYWSGGIQGVTCSGVNTGTFTSLNGIVTHC